MTAAMTCRDCRADLPAYLDRDLPRADRSRVAAHLESCSRCHAEYCRLRDLQRDLHADLPGLGRLDANRAGLLWQAVQGELRAPRRAVWPVSQRRLSALAALIVCAAGHAAPASNAAAPRGVWRRAGLPPSACPRASPLMMTAGIGVTTCQPAWLAER